MATYDYQNIKDNIALPLLLRFGTDVVVTRVEDTTIYEKEYDPITFIYYWVDKVTGQRFDTQPTSTTKTYNGQCVLTQYTDEERRNTNILETDRKLLAMGIPDPKPGDTYTLTSPSGVSVTYKYVNNSPVAPSNDPIVHRIQVRA